MGIIFGALTSLAIGMSDLFGRRVVNARGPIVAGAAASRSRRRRPAVRGRRSDSVWRRSR